MTTGDTPAANKEVVFNYFTDATALSNALLTNAVDIVTNVQSPDALGLFEDNPDYVVNNGTSTTKELMAFNDRVEPFDKVEVRKAVYSAIDRAKLLNAVWGDKGTLIGSMVPPTDPWYVDLVDENPYDPELSPRSCSPMPGTRTGSSSRSTRRPMTLTRWSQSSSRASWPRSA